MHETRAISHRRFSFLAMFHGLPKKRGKNIRGMMPPVFYLVSRIRKDSAACYLSSLLDTSVDFPAINGSIGVRWWWWELSQRNPRMIIGLTAIFYFLSFWVNLRWDRDFLRREDCRDQQRTTYYSSGYYLSQFIYNCHIINHVSTATTTALAVYARVLSAKI